LIQKQLHLPTQLGLDPELNSQIIKAFDNLAKAEFKGNLIIIEPGKVRIRRR